MLLKPHTALRRLAVQRRMVCGGAPRVRLYGYRYKWRGVNTAADSQPRSDVSAAGFFYGRRFASAGFCACAEVARERRRCCAPPTGNGSQRCYSANMAVISVYIHIERSGVCKFAAARAAPVPVGEGLFTTVKRLLAVESVYFAAGFGASMCMMRRMRFLFAVVRIRRPAGLAPTSWCR